MQMKGMRPTRQNIKECSFRKHLLQYCRESFEALLKSPLTEEKKADEKEEDRAERDFKTKHKLFGNIEFVGELFKEMIVSDMVMNQVFNSLLGINIVEVGSVNDNTIEAAIRLISNVGLTLEDRISKEDKKGKLQEMMTQIFERFRELEALPNSDTTVSPRIKILIKNMFDNKASGWKKSKDDKKIQKKEEVAQ